MRLRKKRPAREVTLHDAVQQGLVTFELRGVGPGVTSEVNIEITKLTDEPLTVVIPRGTRFVPASRQETEAPDQGGGR